MPLNPVVASLEELPMFQVIRTESPFRVRCRERDTCRGGALKKKVGDQGLKRKIT
jgi:hypothetical protein